MLLHAAHAAARPAHHGVPVLVRSARVSVAARAAAADGTAGGDVVGREGDALAARGGRHGAGRGDVRVVVLADALRGVAVDADAVLVRGVAAHASTVHTALPGRGGS